jgi:predicted aconitase with swiveling domain
MITKFKGRAIIKGDVKGKALVTSNGFNTYASFFNSIHLPSHQAFCADSGNPDLYGKDLAHKIICLPNTTGSTSSGAVWQRLIKMGNAPKAMLFSKPIDTLAAGGLIVADIWAGEKIVTLDCLGDEFLQAVQEGDHLVITQEGIVLIHD